MSGAWPLATDHFNQYKKKKKLKEKLNKTQDTDKYLSLNFNVRKFVSKFMICGEIFSFTYLRLKNANHVVLVCCSNYFLPVGIYTKSVSLRRWQGKKAKVQLYQLEYHNKQINLTIPNMKVSGWVGLLGFMAYQPL